MLTELDFVAVLAVLCLACLVYQLVKHIFKIGQIVPEHPDSAIDHCRLRDMLTAERNINTRLNRTIQLQRSQIETLSAELNHLRKER